MTFRYWIRVAGAVLFGLGLLCLPSIARSPRSYTSGFAVLSDTGSVIWIALVFIVLGTLIFLASFVGSK